MAQLAAYGLALTAAERASQPGSRREVESRRTQRALIEARPSSRLVGWAMERMSAATVGFSEDSDGPAVAAVLRAEADAIAAEFQSAHAAIASALAEVLPQPEDRPLAVLVHGDQGALHGGSIGTGLTALRRLRDEGRDLRIYVTETRPFMDGARLASWELRQADLAHKVIADSAVAWLFERETIDAVLVAAEWIATNGDTAAVIGSRAVAQQAALASPGGDGARPRVIVSGVSASIDPGCPDGQAIPVELRPARDLSAYLADVPIRASDAVVPATDVIPAELIGTLVTERGMLTPVTAEALRGLMASPAGEPS
jgi:methylthioribose-1-phosphate isomerase